MGYLQGQGDLVSGLIIGITGVIILFIGVKKSIPMFPVTLIFQVLRTGMLTSPIPENSTHKLL